MFSVHSHLFDQVGFVGNIEFGFPPDLGAQFYSFITFHFRFSGVSDQQGFCWAVLFLVIAKV
jgi:hypothetical protein